MLLMTQLLPAGDSDLHARFRALVYQSIVGPPTGVAPARRQAASAAPAADDHDAGEDERRPGEEPRPERLVEERPRRPRRPRSG